LRSVYTSSYCGDNIRIKHSIESEKSFLNKEELNKLEKLLVELCLNIKYSLISSEFCSNLTYSKIESDLNDFFSVNECDCANGAINVAKLIKIFSNNKQEERLNFEVVKFVYEAKEKKFFYFAS
jgi:hypothetical protein